MTDKSITLFDFSLACHVMGDIQEVFHVFLTNLKMPLLIYFSLYIANRSALAVNCCVIMHCLKVSCKEDQITGMQPE